MTVFLPLQASAPLPHSPSFLLPSANPAAQLAKTIHAIVKAKRIVVVCGAGISVQAGIPDFRSPEGLFKSLKRDNPREALASGKDLFDAAVFNSESTTSLFCQMMARLSELSEAAQPTPFHQVLRALDDRGKLLRVYTQNIDAIEEKCGLSFGVPEFEGKRRIKGSPPKPKACSATSEGQSASNTPSRLPSPPVETPRCIPLHGTLQAMHCQVCNHSFPLLEHLPALALGQPPPCPECTSLEATRQLIGKRPRGIGKLRPSVVLYNEAHKDGEGVGDVVEKDLIGSSKGKGRSGADLLLVVGTSLRVPGTKRMVREFAKAVRSRGAGTSTKEEPVASGSSTPAPSPRRTPTSDEESPVKAVYLNLDFPFAHMLQEEIEKDARAKELAIEKKRRRDELIAEDERLRVAETLLNLKSAKRKNEGGSSMPTKKQKPFIPLSPPMSPPLSSVLPPQHHEEDSSKLTVRIPARSIQRPVPEVYITTLPPFCTPAKRPVASDIQFPPTPGGTPPKFNLRTKKGRSAARAYRSQISSAKTTPTTSQRGTAPPSPVTPNDDDENEHMGDRLPETFVRTLQYGLRRSGG
ncbi:DHS-like NAD/FAD-binding domain-containing protein [Crucibulum laeve]|uniref:DHS-like NAD/FAD-binding domain-containing protein n=1 Tax=Crucibulum laeve TaxID=68775 RepID=A0A5C3M4E8_9AGAR|nr:DHS-like NAD/FAD-binding domain-containing protein [Crucibulum laeve]